RGRLAAAAGGPGADRRRTGDHGRHGRVHGPVLAAPLVGGDRAAPLHVQHAGGPDLPRGGRLVPAGGVRRRTGPAPGRRRRTEGNRPSGTRCARTGRSLWAGGSHHPAFLRRAQCCPIRASTTVAGTIPRSLTPTSGSDVVKRTISSPA